MNLTHDERYIADAILDTNTPAHMLDEVQAATVRRSVEIKFCNWPRRFLWESLRRYVAKRRLDGWLKITEYIGSNRSILFLDEHDGKAMWLFSSGDDLRTVLENIPPCDFYVTAENTTYILCFSHHDILYGAGECESWVSALEEQ